MPTLLLMVAPQVVIMTNYGATSDNEGRNTTILNHMIASVPGK